VVVVKSPCRAFANGRRLKPRHLERFPPCVITADRHILLHVPRTRSSMKNVSVMVFAAGVHPSLRILEDVTPPPKSTCLSRVGTPPPRSAHLFNVRKPQASGFACFGGSLRAGPWHRMLFRLRQAGTGSRDLEAWAARASVAARRVFKVDQHPGA